MPRNYAQKEGTFAGGRAQRQMPRRTDIHKILIIGSGPIVIGQACEFDYSGTQACKALRAEGLRGRAGQLQPGDDHDRPGDGRPHLHRAAHGRVGRGHHPARAPRRAAADPRRADRAQPRDGARRRGRARRVRRRDDRREARGHQASPKTASCSSRRWTKRACRCRAAASRTVVGRGRGRWSKRPATRPSSARRSRSAARAAASPTTPKSSRRSSAAGSRPRPSARC